MVGKQDACAMGLCQWKSWGREEEGFFFVKKNQKTFFNSDCAIRTARGPTHKSFLLLFYKKEELDYPAYAVLPISIPAGVAHITALPRVTELRSGDNWLETGSRQSRVRSEHVRNHGCHA